MNGVNRCTFVGNLARDPEVRYAQSGSAVCKMTIGVSSRVKSGNDWKEHTEWVPITCFGKTAENAGQYLQKGRQIYVEGRFQTQKYQNKDGKDKYSTEIIADQVLFLGGGAGGGGSKKPKPKPKQRDEFDDEPLRGDVQNDDYFVDDDLPF